MSTDESTMARAPSRAALEPSSPHASASSGHRPWLASAWLAYACALAVAVAFVSLVSRFANPIPPQWDGVYYLAMAEPGPSDAAHLVAPFAYRPAMPWLAHLAAELSSLPTLSGFAVVAWLSAVALLVAVFGLARSLSRRWWHALVPMVLLGAYFPHVKLPLHFPLLVDVAAYPLMVLATWALLRRRLGLCLAISGVGLLFKEFLAVPFALAVLALAALAVRHRSPRSVARVVAATTAGVLAVVLPRVLVPVSETFQFVDPINDPASLRLLLLAPLDELRNFNIVLALVSCWLPTLMLVTRRRLERVWSKLAEAGALGPVLGSLALVLLLTMYGGTNLGVFVGYTVGVQAVVLALLVRQGVGRVEIAWAVVAVVATNELLRPIPSPLDGFDAYIDFYGGWSSRVTVSSVARLVELVGLVAVAAALRRVLGHPWAASLATRIP